MVFRTMTQMFWRLFTRFVKALLLTGLLLAIAITAFANLAPTFGANSSGQSLARTQASSNFKDGRFVNLVETQLDTSEPGSTMDITTFIFPAEGKNPSSTLPSQSFNKTEFTADEFVWFGHSTILFNTAELTIIADPVFNRASPVPYIGEPFDYMHKPVVTDLPQIDVVLISHDHYDHLDHIAIGDLATTTKQFLVPLGLKAHLTKWGVSADKITELDWYDSKQVGSVEFTLTPSRHFSGRGITNRFSTLWGSWVVSSANMNVFFSGDSGYFDEFKNIGDRFGPFDIAFIENGAYNDDWKNVHMMPEDSVQAAVDLNANRYFPIHWGKFDLSKHHWLDPIQRATVAAAKLQMPIVTPLVGEVFTLEDAPSGQWWNDMPSGY